MTNSKIIKRINYLKDFGIFSDFSSKDSGIEDFENYNLFYGWNGTGKTTITRLFQAIEKGVLSDDYNGASFSVELENGNKITQDDLMTSNLQKKVKVFNKNFIEENIDLEARDDKKGKAKALIYISEANKDKATELKSVRKQCESKVNEIADLENQLGVENKPVKGSKQGEIEDFLKQVAVNIRSYTDFTPQKYTKVTVKNSYNNFIEDSKAIIINEEELQKLKGSINTKTNNYSIIDSNISNNSDFNRVIGSVVDILEFQVVQKSTIERLTKNPDIEEWVKCGRDLHITHGEEKCEFCGNDIKNERLKKIKAHFGKEREEFDDRLELLLQNIQRKNKSFLDVSFPDKRQFHHECLQDYLKVEEVFISISLKIKELYNFLINYLELKKKSPFAILEAPEIKNFEGLNKSYAKLAKDFESLKEKHNKKCYNFEAEIENKRQKVISHFLNANKESYDRLVSESYDMLNNIKIESDNLKILRESKTRLEEEVEETKVALKQINQYLCSYLGHKEIQLQEFEEGYQIRRHGKLAKNLSEGEKTAIAFAYFIATLKEEGFELKDSVVVIDDPISSLDTNNLQYAFSFMMTHTKDAGQLFVLTHNFTFFKLARRTFKSFGKNRSKYMLKCSIGQNGKRSTRIKSLDKLLYHDSEYQYLFKSIYEIHINNNQDLSFEQLYPFFNMSRKVLETFLAFKCPLSKPKESMRDQIERALCFETRQPYDNAKKKALISLTNEGSHSLLNDITEGGVFENLPQLKQSIDILIDFIKEIDPDHFKGLCECVGVQVEEAASSKIPTNAA